MYQAGHMESGHSPVSRIQLDAKDTVITQLSHFIQGVKDACRFPVVFRQIQQDARVRSNVVRASVIQLLLLLSVLALEFIVSSLTRRGLEDSHKGKLSWYFEVLLLAITPSYDDAHLAQLGPLALSITCPFLLASKPKNGR